MLRIFLFPILLVLFSSGSVSAQSALKDYSLHVQSQDQILETLYASISGAKGEERDWKLFRYLFAEDARLIPVRKDQNGLLSPTIMSPEEFASQAGPFFEENGFFEKEIHRVVEEFGPITHAFSTYESYRSASDKEPFARGINSIQLMDDGERWWIVNIYWSAESDENPIPEKYLPRE